MSCTVWTLQVMEWWDIHTDRKSCTKTLIFNAFLLFHFNEKERWGSMSDFTKDYVICDNIEIMFFFPMLWAILYFYLLSFIFQYCVILMSLVDSFIDWCCSSIGCPFKSDSVDVPCSFSFHYCCICPNHPTLIELLAVSLWKDCGERSHFFFLPLLPPFPWLYWSSIEASSFKPQTYLCICKFWSVSLIICSA